MILLQQFSKFSCINRGVHFFVICYSRQSSDCERAWIPVSEPRSHPYFFLMRECRNLNIPARIKRGLEQASHWSKLSFRNLLPIHEPPLPNIVVHGRLPMLAVVRYFISLKGRHHAPRWADTIPGIPPCGLPIWVHMEGGFRTALCFLSGCEYIVNGAIKVAASENAIAPALPVQFRFTFDKQLGWSVMTASSSSPLSASLTKTMWDFFLLLFGDSCFLKTLLIQNYLQSEKHNTHLRPLHGNDNFDDDTPIRPCFGRVLKHMNETRLLQSCGIFPSGGVKSIVTDICF